MLFVYMHNNENYLYQVSDLLKKNGIPESDIVKIEGLGSFTRESDYLMSLGINEMSSYFSKALILVVENTKTVQTVMNLINSDPGLSVIGSQQKGFVCVLPYEKILDIRKNKNKTEEKMEISKYLDVKLVNLNLLASEKKGAIYEVAESMKKSSGLRNFDLLANDLFDREKLATTGIGNEIAIPHARTDSVDRILIALGISKSGIEYGSMDGQKVKIIFMIGTPVSEINTYLILLAQLARVLKDAEFKEELLGANHAEDIIELFKNKEI